MRITHVFLTTALTVALTLPMLGSITNADTARAAMKKHTMSRMMGKPTVEATVEGLQMKVWLMTQKHHKKMMKEKMGHMMMGKDMKHMRHEGMEMNDTSMRMGKDMEGMKHEGMGMNKAMMDSMMTGTHHIMLNVKDVSLGKEVIDASVKLMIMSPSKKSSSVDLMPMMSNFGGALTLSEKGKYHFTLSVIVGGVSKTTEFQYKVK